MNRINTQEIKRLIISHNLTMFGRTVFNIFFAVFVWTQTNSLQAIATYSIALIIGHGISFTSLAGIVNRGRPHIPRLLSLVGSSILYIVLFVFKEYIPSHLIITGLALGFFNGMYWLSYLFIQFATTNKQNRGNYNGMIEATRNFVNLIAPIVGGAAIGLNIFNLGYGNIFIIGTISYVLSAIIGNVKIEKYTNTPLNYKKTIKALWYHKDITKLLASRFFGNLAFKGAFERLLPIFIFDVLNSELELGTWFSVFSILAIVSVWLIGKKIDYKHYRSLLTFGGSIFFLASMSVVGAPLFATYILYGFARQFFLPMMEIPAKTYRDNLLHTLPNYKNHRVEYIVIREWVYVIMSRIASYSLLFFVPSLSSTHLQTVLGIMACGILIQTLFMRSIKMKLTHI